MGIILLSMIAIGVNFDFHSIIDAGTSTVSNLATQRVLACPQSSALCSLAPVSFGSRYRLSARVRLRREDILIDGDDQHPTPNETASIIVAVSITPT
eukprot:5201404-Prymnesium_polylepis.1